MAEDDEGAVVAGVRQSVDGLWGRPGGASVLGIRSQAMPDRSRMHQESSLRKRSHGRFVGPDTDRRAQGPSLTVVITEYGCGSDLVVIAQHHRLN